MNTPVLQLLGTCFVLLSSMIQPKSVAAEEVTTDSLPGALDVSSSLIEVTLNLGLVLAAIVLLAWIFKRVQGMDQPAAGQLRVTASLPLGPKERILVVQVGQQQLLVGASSAGINMLHVLDAPIQEAAQNQSPESFRDKLIKSLRGAPS